MQRILVVVLSAHGGRHVLVQWQQGKLVARRMEVFRQNQTEEEAVVAHIAAGVQRCVQQGLPPDALMLCAQECVGVLLDEQDRVVWHSDTVPQAARDAVHALVSPQALYYASGIRAKADSALYGLAALCEQDNALLRRAQRFGTVADALNLRLTGVWHTEATAAAVTGLLSTGGKAWNTDLLCALRLPEKLFAAQPAAPGTVLGPLLPSLAQQTGFTGPVVLAPHAAAAVCGVLPAQTAAYLCSKDKVLLGMRTAQPRADEKSRRAGFSYPAAGNGFFCCTQVEAAQADEISQQTVRRMAQLLRTTPTAVYAPYAREEQRTALAALGLPVCTEPNDAAALAAALPLLLDTTDSDALCRTFWADAPQA